MSHYKLYKKTLKRVLYNYRILKQKLYILKKHSSKKVLDLINHINNVTYQIVFDEFGVLEKISPELLHTIEMNQGEFESSVYVDVLFERFLPQPNRTKQTQEVEKFQFPIMLERLDIETENTYPFIHLLIYGKIIFSKSKNLYQYFLTVENISSIVELEYFQKTDSLINSLSISNFQLLKAKKNIEMHKLMLISLTCSLVGEYSMETSVHLKKMQLLTSCLAHECKRLDLIHVTKYDIEEYVKDISYTSVLHDIGKMAISHDILDKDDNLSPKEMDEMIQHPSIGASYIKKIMDMFAADPEYETYCDFLQIPWEICLYHHERWDGKGYPKGLKGEDIPITARIVAVSDTYEALRGERIYNHNRKDHIEALSVIREASGTQFDPKIVDAFFSIENKIEQIYKEEDL